MAANLLVMAAKLIFLNCAEFLTDSLQVLVLCKGKGLLQVAEQKDLTDTSAPLASFLQKAGQSL